MEHVGKVADDATAKVVFPGADHTPEGEQWNKAVHQHQFRWLAKWVCNVTGKLKYVTLASDSRVKGEYDISKFELARTWAHAYITYFRSIGLIGVPVSWRFVSVVLRCISVTQIWC